MFIINNPIKFNRQGDKAFEIGAYRTTEGRMFASVAYQLPKWKVSERYKFYNLASYVEGQAIVKAVTTSINSAGENSELMTEIEKVMEDFKNLDFGGHF